MGQAKVSWWRWGLAKKSLVGVEIRGKKGKSGREGGKRERDRGKEREKYDIIF